MPRFLAFFVGGSRPYSELALPFKFIRVLGVAFRCYRGDHLAQRALSLTYYTLFAIVPVAALLFGIAKGFALQERLENMLTERFSNHQDILNWIYQFADTTLREARGGVVAGVGVIMLIWSVIRLATNIELSFNLIWHLPPRRNLLRRFSDYLAILLVTPIILVILGSAGMLLRKLTDFVLAKLPWLTGTPVNIISTGLELMPVFLVCVVFSLIYLMVPNTKVRWGSAFFGGIMAGIIFQFFQDACVLLQGTLYRYNTIYGSFAALPILLLFMQFSWQITLFGAVIAYVKQTASTGLFDHPYQELTSCGLRRKYELTLARDVYHNFDIGEGETSIGELRRKLPLPPVLFDFLIRELLNAKVLLRLEGEKDVSFAPARPTAEFTVCDALRQLDAIGDTLPPESVRRELSGAEGVLEKLERSTRKSPDNRLLKDL